MKKILDKIMITITFLNINITMEKSITNYNTDNQKHCKQALNVNNQILRDTESFSQYNNQNKIINYDITKEIDDLIDKFFIAYISIKNLENTLKNDKNHININNENSNKLDEE